jgi:hypothetical protein
MRLLQEFEGVEKDKLPHNAVEKLLFSRVPRMSIEVAFRLIFICNPVGDSLLRKGAIRAVSGINGFNF